MGIGLQHWRLHSREFDDIWPTSGPIIQHPRPKGVETYRSGNSLSGPDHPLRRADSYGAKRPGTKSALRPMSQ